jgi:hypothetical protein
LAFISEWPVFHSSGTPPAWRIATGTRWLGEWQERILGLARGVQRADGLLLVESLADCAAVVHLPLVSAATKIVYGCDFLADLPVRDYLKRMNDRPTMQQVNADRKTNTELLMARAKAKA